MNGLNHIEWKRRLEKVVQGDKYGPAARNLRKGGIFFRREPGNICTSRNEYFLNRVIPIWNELPQNVREAGSVNGFKAGLDRLKSFSF